MTNQRIPLPNDDAGGVFVLYLGEWMPDADEVLRIRAHWQHSRETGDLLLLSGPARLVWIGPHDRQLRRLLIELLPFTQHALSCVDRNAPCICGLDALNTRAMALLEETAS